MTEVVLIIFEAFGLALLFICILFAIIKVLIRTTK